MQDALIVSRPDREANVVLVTYQNTDPELAQSVVNALTSDFIVGRQGAESTEERHTVGFLEGQLDSLRLQLLAAEVRLRDFSTASRIVAPEEQAAGQVQRLIEMKTERDLKEAERLPRSTDAGTGRGGAATLQVAHLSRLHTEGCWPFRRSSPAR
jgi:uncharacterized protein involved in exopolysaccharide biosynthesis